MSGFDFSLFPDLVNSMGSGKLKTPAGKAVVNLTSQYRNYSWPKMIAAARASGRKIMARGGLTFRFDVMFEDNDSYEHFRTGSQINFANTDSITQGEMPWARSRVKKMWTEDDFKFQADLMAGSGTINGDDLLTQIFYSVYEKKEMEMWGAFANGTENDLWRVPVYTEMEGATASGDPRKPNSLFVYCNENTDGLFTGWTEICGIAPSASPTSRWQNQISSYTTADFSYGGIASALHEMVLKIQWEPPETFKQYYDEPTLSGMMIRTSAVGHKAYGALLLEDNKDRTHLGGQDTASFDPTFKGIPIKYVSALDTAAVYDNGSGTLVAEDTADNKGPRFYFINGNWTFPIVHADQFMEPGRVVTAPGTDDVFAQTNKTTWQLVCMNPSGNGLVQPSADLFY